MYDISYSELPSVDDLEVAAAAAAAAMDPDNVTSADDTDSSSENDEVRFHCMMTQMCVPRSKSVCEVWQIWHCVQRPCCATRTKAVKSHQAVGTNHQMMIKCTAACS